MKMITLDDIKVVEADRNHKVLIDLLRFINDLLNSHILLEVAHAHFVLVNLSG